MTDPPTTRSPIAKLEALIIGVPAEGNAFAQGNEETLLVRVTDENGLYGIGECITTPAVSKAMIDMATINFWSKGIGDTIIGEDPLEAAALFDRVYHGSFYHGRRGTFIQALSGVDIAMYDLAGKQLGVPVYKLLGGGTNSADQAVRHVVSRRHLRPAGCRGGGTYRGTGRNRHGPGASGLQGSCSLRP